MITPSKAESPELRAESYKCSACSRKLESDSIYSTEDGAEHCEDCYDEETFLCTLCKEREETQYQHNVIAIYEPNECFYEEGQEPGLYRISGLPYFADGMIEAHIYRDRVDRISALPEGAEPSGCGYPAGHLCRACVKQHVPQCKKVKGGGS